MAKSKKEEIILTFLEVVKADFHKPYTYDNRIKADYYVAEYKGNDGEIYRKTYWIDGNKQQYPNIVKRGTHKEINESLIQIPNVKKNPSLAQCKKLIEQEKQKDYKPTISHYRDIENGMKKAHYNKRDLENFLSVATGNTSVFYKQWKLQELKSEVRPIWHRLSEQKKISMMRHSKRFQDIIADLADVKNPTTKTAVNPRKVANVSASAKSLVALRNKVKLRTGNGARPVALESFTDAEQIRILSMPQYFDVSGGYVYLVKKNPTTKTRANSAVRKTANPKNQTGALTAAKRNVSTWKKISNLITKLRTGRGYTSSKSIPVYGMQAEKVLTKLVNDTSKQEKDFYSKFNISITGFLSDYPQLENERRFYISTFRDSSYSKNPTKTKPNYSNFDFDFDKKIPELSKMFQGKVNGQSKTALASDLQPDKTARIGKLSKLIINGLNGKKYELVDFGNDAWVSMDRRKNLWLSGKDSRLDLRANGIKIKNNQMECLGYLTQINYITDKKHIENGAVVEYYHKLGEVNKQKPTLWADADGFLIVNGGDYDVWKEGIVN